MDLFAADYAVVPPGQAKIIHTGIAIELPPGYEAQVRSRSGLALKKRVFVLNAPGTIDPSYRGEVGVILFNAGSEHFEVEPGDRVAQMVIARYVGATVVRADELAGSLRGQGGFGSTGIKESGQ